RPQQRRVVVATSHHQVVALAAGQEVRTRAAVEGQPDHARLQAARVDDVVPALAGDGEQVRGALAAGDLHGGRQPRDGHPARGPADLDVVGAGGTVDEDGVGRPVAGAAARRDPQVDVHRLEVGAGQVADGDLVGAAQGAEVHALDAVEVHRHAGDVAGEAHPAAVGRDVDLLVGV